MMIMKELISSYLMAYLFWSGIALGRLFWEAISRWAGGRWSGALEPLLRSSFAGWGALIALFLPIPFFLSILYPWAGPQGLPAELSHLSAYLNPIGFIARSAFYLSNWILVAWALSWSRGLEVSRRVAALSLLALSITVSFAMIDWVMSLEAPWVSTTYGLVWIIGDLLSAFAFLVLIRKPVPSRDQGNLLLSMVMAWGYVSFVQSFILWLGNLPEDVVWVKARTEGGWGSVAAALAVFELALPFFLLLFRGIKERKGAMSAVAILLLAARAVEVVWLCAPGLGRSRASIHWADPLAFALIGWIWLWADRWGSPARISDQGVARA